jgi:hypothetical protein
MPLAAIIYQKKKIVALNFESSFRMFMSCAVLNFIEINTLIGVRL